MSRSWALSNRKPKCVTSLMCEVGGKAGQTRPRKPEMWIISSQPLVRAPTLVHRGELSHQATEPCRRASGRCPQRPAGEHGRPGQNGEHPSTQQRLHALHDNEERKESDNSCKAQQKRRGCSMGARQPRGEAAFSTRGAILHPASWTCQGRVLWPREL